MVYSVYIMYSIFFLYNNIIRIISLDRIFLHHQYAAYIYCYTRATRENEFRFRTPRKSLFK